MRKFEVLKCAQQKTTQELKRRKDRDGNSVSYMVYKVVKAGEDGWYPGAYGVENIKVGDIIELDGYLADKCSGNPDFKEVFEKRKPGRPKKIQAEAA